MANKVLAVDGEAMADIMNHPCRRKEDTMKYQLSYLAKMIGALAVLGGAYFWLGSTKFQTKDEAALQDQKIQQAVIDNTEVKTEIRYIRDDVKYIREHMK
jgi:hypothetical protein